MSVFSECTVCQEFLTSAILRLSKFMPDSFFVALEGIDGAGKDTVAAMLSRHIFEGGKHFVITSEPSAGPTGVFIRSILDGKSPAPETNEEFQRLYIEDRLEHIRSVIRPALLRGEPVLSVRYWFSTLAYGMLTKPLQYYIKLHEEVMGEEMVYPDLTVILDVDVEEALMRIQAAGRSFEWFEKRERLMRIREYYLLLAGRTDLGNIEVVYAKATPAVVLEETLRHIEAVADRSVYL